MEPSSMASLLKRYSVPLTLLSLAIFFQLIVTPSVFPRSHYDVLGVPRYSSVEEVREAYGRLSSKWNSDKEATVTEEYVKIRYAFELLTDPLWKRDYDLFGIDEKLHAVKKVVESNMGKRFSEVNLPLLSASSPDLVDDAFDELTYEEFYSTIGNTSSWLIQVYSLRSDNCAQFSSNWRRIARLLDGVANTSMVELGKSKLAAYLADRKSTGQPFFRNGLPLLVALPLGCRNSDCLVRYQGEHSVDAVTDWFATYILGLPRILYYSKETLGQNFIAKSGHHKVKVIFFSRSGERAAPFLRQAAKDYWAYASFALVLWREEESSLWWNTFEVESAPAIIFLKDPGVKPVVFHGAVNSSSFSSMMERNKIQDLPQLRSVTSMEMGCDARGYSRAGNDTTTWYCVILAGRPSQELTKMRETIRSVQAILSSDGKSSANNKDAISVPLKASAALIERRLTFTWLDGEVQKKYCFFYLHSESSYETCGPRRDLTDVPQLFIVRYKRNFTEDETNAKRKHKTMWDTYREDNEHLASQLVARYNGSDSVPEIMKWVAQIIDDGDSTDLPFYEIYHRLLLLCLGQLSYLEEQETTAVSRSDLESEFELWLKEYRVETPELIPEDGDPMWSKGAQRIVSTSKSIRHKISSIVTGLYDWMGDPRVGPILLLSALLSFGGIYLQKDQSTQPVQPSTECKDHSVYGVLHTSAIWTRDKKKPTTRSDKLRATRFLFLHNITKFQPVQTQVLPSSNPS
ncbi:hypothetical protein Sjap_015614 [Stephania japonica]|uniref:J domain-containing protein n=1 Tax=Stephania japonica TaxID=461633 RepID=A0AAP0IJR2_9MAGN